ncbi:unnamed protein product [Paramecium octaurelia]|uniref:EGF-like domain-containing protein n=1 Tax=Paramecium octaurelia TaxID=43137 RepID=A0A8S1Y245_PAROT|nr:unnamed protein product [Paramecium octaurelia]
MKKCIFFNGYYDEGQLQCSSNYFEYEKGALVQLKIIICTWKNSLTLCATNVHIVCSSCSVKTENCTACPLQSYRDLGIDNACSCQTNMYEQPNNPICIPCHYTCFTCNGTESNQCTSCYTEIMRQSNDSGSCLCMNKYYDAGKPDCQACSPQCLNCANSADSYRYLFGNTCICQNKRTGAFISMYEVQGKADCQSCHYSCLDCNGSQFNQCTKCLDSEARILSNSTCVCAPYYFEITNLRISQFQFKQQKMIYRSSAILDNHNVNNATIDVKLVKIYLQIFQLVLQTLLESYPFNDNAIILVLIAPPFLSNTIPVHLHSIEVETCLKCHYSCLTCNKFGNQFCQTCKDKSISFRVFNQGVCQCLPGYFDDGVSPNCQKCLISCLTCLNTATNCYFEINQAKCGKCDQNYLNCSIKSKMCTECDQSQMRTLSDITKTCICKTGTTEINGQCRYCDITCNTCQNSIINCTSCKLLRLFANNQCRCINGTYEMFLLQSNLPNVHQPSKLLYILFRGSFLKFFLQEIFVYAKMVIMKTQSLQIVNLAIHLVQPVISLLLIDQLSECLQQCVCSTGLYFNSVSLKCEACNINCLECKSQLECIECEQLTRHFDPDKLECPCKDGYYEVNAKICSFCDYCCRTCQTSPTKCLSCEPLYFRHLNSNQCICLEGYYDIGIETCYLCDPTCLTCQKTSTQCTSCNQTQHFRSLNLNQCICQSGYYDIGQLVCQSKFMINLYNAPINVSLVTANKDFVKVMMFNNLELINLILTNVLSNILDQQYFYVNLNLNSLIK